MSEPAKYAIVAALEREISGLVKGWESGRISNLKFWRRGELVAAVAGMGWDKAFAGTNVVIEAFRPELITSIGFSGALSTDLPVASIFVPAQVIGFKTGAAFQTGFGTGTLVTAAGVAGVNDKSEMAARYGAQAVDMEAAAVSEAASTAGVRFAAIRAISDGVNDEMDFLGAFVTPDGFKTRAFLAYVAVRPRLWKALARLGENTRLASEALTVALKEFAADPEKYLARDLNRHMLKQSSSKA
jgi:nucleoside phosphorylase